MKNIVIITAKGGNKSVPNKNVIPILGMPVLTYPIRAAKLSRLATQIYLTTEDDAIRVIGEQEGVSIIDRPSSLSQPESQHKDVIQHAIEDVKKRLLSIDNIIVLLGNTVQITSGLIDKAFHTLMFEECDSVMTGWKAQDDHPYRAMKINNNGFVEAFEKREVSSNRQSYPDVFFYDQGIWGMKYEAAIRQKGPPPWVWLGERCKLIERPWVTGRDIHSWIDVSASSWYLTGIQANDFLDYEQ
jgi:CMP-N-acetylneuraminic acid synthetase